MNSNWFKLVMKMTKVEYGKNLLLKGVPIIFNKGGAKLKIGENVTIKSSFLSNLVGLYSRTIIVTRAPGAEIEIGDGVPSSYSKFRDWLGRRSALRETLETYIRNDALWWNLEEALADLDLDTPSMAIPEMLDAFGAYDPDAQMADYYAAIDMAMDPVDTITNELPKKLRKWIESIKYNYTIKYTQSTLHGRTDARSWSSSAPPASTPAWRRSL